VAIKKNAMPLVHGLSTIQSSRAAFASFSTKDRHGMQSQLQADKRRHLVFYCVSGKAALAAVFYCSFPLSLKKNPADDFGSAYDCATTSASFCV
jgi:hypothetical protein